MQFFIFKPDFGPIVVFLGLSPSSWASRVIGCDARMIRTSPGRSGSEYWTRIRTHSSFTFDAPMQNSNADAYRTVRNAVPDADAGSVAVRYRTLLRYRRKGGRADPDFGPDPRLNPQTGYRIVFKAKI